MSDTRGRINFAENEHKTADNHPTHKGFISAEQDIPAGTVLQFAVWPAKNGNGFSGTLSDKYEKPAEENATQEPVQEALNAPTAEPEEEDDSSEIPF